MENLDPRKILRLVHVECTTRSDGYLDWKYRLAPTDQNVDLIDYKPTFTSRNDLATHSFSYPPAETIGQVVLSEESGAGMSDGIYTEVLHISENNAADLYEVTVQHAYITGEPPSTEDIEILNDPRKP